MKVATTIESLQDLLKDWTEKKHTIALVPTMGGLHEGHLSLVRMAKNQADKVVVSVYLNPAQFAQNEDFDSYPISTESDIVELEKCNADAVFIPNSEQIYPKDWSFDYQVGEISSILCGVTRPHFFNGVAKVVYRLFEIVRPDIAIFGQKDFQQLFVIKKMVDDLSLGINILSHSIVREQDGLAMSTRNKYLNKKERVTATQLSTCMNSAKDKYLSGMQIDKVNTELRQELSENFELDYAEIVDANTLKIITDNTVQIGILCAVVLGSTRLIDNITFWR